MDYSIIGGTKASIFQDLYSQACVIIMELLNPKIGTLV